MHRHSPVVFLDFDGVIANTRDWFERRGPRPKNPTDRLVWHFDPLAVARLDAIHEPTRCRFVISSTWRLDSTVEQLRELLRLAGMVSSDAVVDKTPWLHGQPRGLEIEAWRLEHHHVGPFAIVDDDGDMEHLIDHLVQTPNATGLDGKHVDEVIEMLTRGES